MNKKFNNLTRGKSVKDLISEIDGVSETTADAVKTLEETPDKTSLIHAVSAIRLDKSLQQEDRTRIIDALKDQYIDLFNFDNCPDDYDSLKNEAKFLAWNTQYSFILMAQRLLKIRDKHLYINDGYPDFKSFIQGELSIAQRTAYDYIDIVSLFKEELRPVAIEEKFEYTKLLPVVPILKAKDNRIPKDEIRRRFLNEIKVTSKRKIIEETDLLKRQYGLIKENADKKKMKAAITHFMKALPETLDAEDRKLLDLFISDLKERL
jgi:hypothetical protein